MRSRQEIDLILRKEVEAALLDFRAANQHLAEVVRELGKSYVAQDNNLALSRAHSRRRAASDRLERALKRHNGWILNDALPKDLAD
ncbi:MAG TPA: hypothetical protein VKB79_25435 [Bryobacteraceae bacterium]|nr:hypothetical protein [Bryobacteraceae bacterium]